ncbi:MAG TPA: PH domain-containing protein [Acidimicrobiales bacterium]|nr:PH domain-containing protein [Acidimicrobiales bacterium]
MAYSELMLRENEKLVLDLHPHWWYFAKAMLATVVTVAIALVVLVELPNGWDWVKLITAVLVLASLVWLAERYVHWVTTYFILTTDRVIYRSGIVAKKGMEIPLQRINTIFFSQRFFERVLGLGDLKIESASRTGAEVFEDIRNPDRVQHEIYAQMEAVEQRGFDRVGDAIAQSTTQTAGSTAPAAAAAPTPTQPSVSDRISDLHRLHAQGAITDAEFEAKKAQLLEQL